MRFIEKIFIHNGFDSQRLSGIKDHILRRNRKVVKLFLWEIERMRDFMELFRGIGIKHSSIIRVDINRMINEEELSELMFTVILETIRVEIACRT